MVRHLPLASFSFLLHTDLVARPHAVSPGVAARGLLYPRGCCAFDASNAQRAPL